MNYQEADSKLQGRCRDSRKIGNNTYLVRHDTYHAVRLHNTEIIKFHADGRIELDSGGWRTVTTKARINDYLPRPWRLLQEKSVWFLTLHGTRYAFADGITIEADLATCTSYDESRYDQDKWLKSIKKYSKGYVDALFVGEVKAPNLGDCWFCAFKWGKDKEHFVSHFKEKYFVGSLLQNAMETFPGLMSQAAKHELACLWSDNGEHKDKLVKGWQDIAKRQIRTTLERYLKKQFSFAS